jgi:hypothetical protein
LSGSGTIESAMPNFKWLFAFLSALALSECCNSGSGCCNPPGGPLASWDGSGVLSRQAAKTKYRYSHNEISHAGVPDRKDKDDTPNPFQPYSKDWWNFQEAREREEDLRLTKAMTICRGCWPAQPDI